MAEVLGKEWIRIVGACALPHLGGALGALITNKQVSTWYGASFFTPGGHFSLEKVIDIWAVDIKKPSWRPPNWIFAPVWTALYTGMGYSSYLIWRDGGGFSGEAALPLALYGSQLLLNWAWSPIFFGAHKLGLATIEISMLWGNIIACIYTFKPINQLAAGLMLPYLGWVSFASFLTYNIWQMNKDPEDKSK